MSSPTPRIAGLSGGVIIGAIEQLVNELTARLRVPVLGAPVGDVIVPSGESQRAGADAVESWFDRLTGGRHDVDPQVARATRPLLASANVLAAGDGSTTHLKLQADAPGADWGVAGRESGMVAVYVDGRYHSSVIVLGERDGGYEVNLGALPRGNHQIEVRACTDVAPLQVRVGTLGVRTVTGEQALVDRLAPIIQLRDVDRGARSSITRSDAPMLLVPAITRNADGTRTIEYRGVFTNEDGGTPLPSLFAQYGRGIDAEPLYRVTVDQSGRVLSERYQATIHRWMDFDGARDGGRPVLRVSTSNNMVSARTEGTRAADRWSDAPVAALEDPASNDYAIMRSNPWTWRVMAKELLREGKAAAVGAVRGATQIADPRRYLYLGPLSDAARAAIELRGGVELVLRDGRRVLAKIAGGFAGGKFHQSALELPPEAVADAIRGVSLLGVQALVLDDTFSARELAQAA